jgi:hypothetical protein
MAIVEHAIAAEYGAGPIDLPLSAIVVTATA